MGAISGYGTWASKQSYKNENNGIITRSRSKVELANNQGFNNLQPSTNHPTDKNLQYAPSFNTQQKPPHPSNKSRQAKKITLNNSNQNQNQTEEATSSSINRPRTAGIQSNEQNNNHNNNSGHRS